MLRHLPSARLLIVVALLVCCGAAGSAVRRSQPAVAQGDFWKASMIALAHGQRDAAAKLASARGASDPLAAVVLAQIAAAKGQYKEAQSLLEPVAAREPAGEAALELALLYRTIGRAGD